MDTDDMEKVVTEIAGYVRKGNWDDLREAIKNLVVIGLADSDLAFRLLNA